MNDLKLPLHLSAKINHGGKINEQSESNTVNYFYNKNKSDRNVDLDYTYETKKDVTKCKDMDLYYSGTYGYIPNCLNKLALPDITVGIKYVIGDEALAIGGAYVRESDDAIIFAEETDGTIRIDRLAEFGYVGVLPIKTPQILLVRKAFPSYSEASGLLEYEYHQIKVPDTIKFTCPTSIISNVPTKDYDGEGSLVDFVSKMRNNNEIYTDLNDLYKCNPEFKYDPLNETQERICEVVPYDSMSNFGTQFSFCAKIEGDGYITHEIIILNTRNLDTVRKVETTDSSGRPLIIEYINQWATCSTYTNIGTIIVNLKEYISDNLTDYKNSNIQYNYYFRTGGGISEQMCYIHHDDGGSNSFNPFPPIKLVNGEGNDDSTDYTFGVKGGKIEYDETTGDYYLNITVTIMAKGKRFGSPYVDTSTHVPDFYYKAKILASYFTTETNDKIDISVQQKIKDNKPNDETLKNIV